MDTAKVNSLEEAQKHFLNNDVVGQVPSVICVKDGEEREVQNLAEAEAFYAEAPAKSEAPEQSAEAGTEPHEESEQGSKGEDEQ